MSLEDFDDSPRTLRIGRHSFTASPLRLRHLAQIKRHIREERPQPLKIATETIAAAPHLSEAQQEKLLSRAYEDQLAAERVTEADVDEFMNAPAGMLHAVFLLIQEHHPELTLARLNAALGTMEQADVPQFYDDVRRLMGAPERPTQQAAGTRTRTPGPITTASTSNSHARRIASRSRRS